MTRLAAALKNAPYVCGLALLFALALGSSNGWAQSAAKTVTWADLRGLDYQTGAPDAAVGGLDGGVVTLSGFSVPLDGPTMELVNEFLFVPDAMACVHVPPPPPNQLIHVLLKEPLPLERFFGPGRLTGRLSVVRAPSEFGAAGYQMEGLGLEPYDDGNDHQPFQFD